MMAPPPTRGRPSLDGDTGESDAAVAVGAGAPTPWFGAVGVGVAGGCVGPAANGAKGAKAFGAFAAVGVGVAAAAAVAVAVAVGRGAGLGGSEPVAAVVVGADTVVGAGACAAADVAGVAAVAVAVGGVVGRRMGGTVSAVLDTGAPARAWAGGATVQSPERGAGLESPTKGIGFGVADLGPPLWRSTGSSSVSRIRGDGNEGVPALTTQASCGITWGDGKGGVESVDVVRETSESPPKGLRASALLGAA